MKHTHITHSNTRARTSTFPLKLISFDRDRDGFGSDSFTGSLTNAPALQV